MSMFSNLKKAMEGLVEGGAGHHAAGTASAAAAPAAAAASTALDSVAHGPAPVADSRATKVSVAGFEVEGVSVAGQETCIIVPRAKVAFDLGRCPQRCVYQQTALITHGHLDHIGGAPFHVTSRNLLSLPPSKLVVHPAYVDGIKAYIDAANALQGNPPCSYEVQSLELGQELRLPSGFLCRTFPTTHTIASQGYILYSMRKKLRADLQGRSQEEIKALRLAGEEVQETQQVPEIAFTGDTTGAFLETVPEDVLHARLLIMEMSFLDDSVSVEDAREKGHMHIADFVANSHRFQNEAILLIHFSSRYKRSEILSHLNTWLPPALKAKVVPLLNGFD